MNIVSVQADHYNGRVLLYKYKCAKLDFCGLSGLVFLSQHLVFTPFDPNIACTHFPGRNF